MIERASYHSVPRTGDRVSPPPPCAPKALDRHRLESAPPCVDRGRVADVPFFMHLRAENARWRLAARAIDDPIPDAERPRAETWKLYRPARAEPGVSTALRSVERVRTNAVTVYAQRRTRWPLGGLIDLVV